MSSPLITSLKAERDQQVAAKRAIIASVEARGSQNLTADETAQVKAHRDRVEALDERIAELEAAEQRDARSAAMRASLGTGVGPAYDGVARVGYEARTYTEHTARSEGVSFFRDGLASALGDYQAADRLARHARESVVEGEQRAISTSSVAGLVPPAYLVNAAALVQRQGRPTANIVSRMPLPPEGMNLIVPRGTSGATVASQTPENTNVSNTDEVWTNLTLPVVTIAGQQDISRQAVERGSNVDQLVFMDLMGAYAAELDRQVLNGSGSSNQMLGILQTAGIYSGTAFGAAVTATNFYSHVGGGLQNVLANRFLPPTHVVMSPRRYAWLLSQVDSAGRPLVVPAGGLNSGQNAQGIAEFGDTAVSGTLLGMTIVVDPSVPLNVGSLSEDVVIVFRASDCWLWEDGDGSPKQLRFEQTLGGQLSVKAVLYGVAAFTAGRYPSAVAKFGGADSTAGNGLVAPVLG